MNGLRCLALNLDGVRASKHKGNFELRESRYRPKGFNKTFIEVLSDLVRLGVFDEITGQRWSKTNQIDPTTCKHQLDKDKQQTVLIPHDFLLGLREYYFATSLEAIGFDRERQEIVYLKSDESSALIEYPYNALTTKLRRQMRRINAELEGAGTLVDQEAVSRLGLTIDPQDRFMVRKFTHESWQSGGRLWGGFWQDGLKRAERPEVLRIKGQPTSELDFDASIINLAYVYAKATPPAGDLYHIPGLSPESRPAIKILMSALLFDHKEKPRVRLPRENKDRSEDTIKKLFAPTDQLKSYKEIFYLIAAHHPALVPYFNQGLGHYLQFVESQVLVNCLLRLRQAGIVALPLHDCFVVGQKDTEAAQCIIEAECQRLVGRTLPLSVK